MSTNEPPPSTPESSDPTPEPEDDQKGFRPLQTARSALRFPENLSLGRDAVGSFFRAPTGRISWRRNLWAIWAAQLLAIMGFNLRIPFLPLYFGELGVESADEQALWTGVILAVGAAMMAITSPIWGALADRKGRKPMLLRAQFASFVTIGLAALVVSPMQMLGLRVIEGALAGTVAAATALVAVTMPKERLGYGLGLIQTAVFSGAAVGPLIGGVLADQIGYRWTFGVASLMLLGAGLITLFFVQEKFTPPTPVKEAPKEKSSWRILLGPVLLSLTFAMLAIRFASSAVQPIIPLFVDELAHTSESTSSLAGVTLGALGLTSAISSVIFGKLGDQRGYTTILMGAALGSGLIYLPMALVQHPWQLIVLQALFGVFAGGMIPAANALIAKVTDPARRGTVFGFMNTAASFGGFLGPLAGAGLAAGIGLRSTFVITAFVLLATVVSLYITNQRHPMESADED